MTGNRRTPSDLRSDNLRLSSLRESGFAWVSPRETMRRLFEDARQARTEDERDKAQWNALVRPLVLAWRESMDEKGRQYPPVVEEW